MWEVARKKDQTIPKKELIIHLRISRDLSWQIPDNMDVSLENSPNTSFSWAVSAHGL
jgi:hypothetical protein